MNASDIQKIIEILRPMQYICSPSGWQDFPVQRAINFLEKAKCCDQVTEVRLWKDSDTYAPLAILYSQQTGRGICLHVTAGENK